MSNSTDNPAEFRKWLDVAVSVSAVLDETAAASDDAGTLVPQAVSALVDSGLLTTPLPREFGGAGLSAAQVLAIIEELSRGNASAGWCAMINLSTVSVLATYLGDEGMAQVFGGSEPAVLAQNRMPVGTARRVPGGYEVEGRYGFGSASAYSNWLGAGAVVLDETGERTPEIISFLVPASGCRLDDDWNVVGLKATASVDFIIPCQFVPDHLVWDNSPATAVRHTGLANASVNANGQMVVASWGHTAVALGMGFRALQEISVVAAGRRRLGKVAGAISDEPAFQDQLARHEAAMRAARAYMVSVVEAIDTADVDWTAPAGNQLCARIRQAAVFAHDAAAQAIGFAAAWAGSAALRTPNVIGRLAADITAARTHIIVDPSTMSGFGGQLVHTLPAAAGASDFGQIA